ncbi:MAG: hypothetical protein NTZ87_04170 [Candidatus Nomurabacteria bacterium]|nr:hypothetical protein [Candidatus Nomurabacteria bacterium]
MKTSFLKIVSVLVFFLAVFVLPSHTNANNPACGVSTSPWVITTLNSSTGGICDWTVPAGVTQIQVKVWGGGGAGGGNGGDDNGGGGGGGGAFGEKTITVVPGSTYTIYVGSGATHGQTEGGPSSFGSLADHLIAYGGGSGKVCTGGGCAGGIGGIPGNGFAVSTKIYGNDGIPPGYYLGDGIWRGGKGGDSGECSLNASCAGKGGLGRKGTGDYDSCPAPYDYNSNVDCGNADGYQGGFPGGGGGGGGDFHNRGDGLGGKGGDGKVVITDTTPAVQTYTVSGTVSGSHGTISPATQTINSGSTTTLTVTPSAGYTATVSGCGGSLSQNTFTTGTITASCTVTASFSATVTPVNGVCGSANGTPVSSTPSTNFCSVGSPSSVSGPGPWSWTCAGSNSGSTASCSANLAVTPPATPSCSSGSFPIDLHGWAWSSNIGWISFNSSDAGAGGGPYKVSVDASGNLNGYAWSSNIGWIKFGGLSGFPSGGGTQAQDAQINGNNLKGWARALSYGGGWDGWISLSGAGPNYGPTISDNTITGYAWGSDVVGWIDFSATTSGGGTTNGVTCGNSNAMSGTLTPASPSCTIVAGASSCSVNLTWTTTNPVGTSAVTATGMSNINGNSGGPTAFTVPYSSRVFHLFNNNVELALSNATSSCVSGTVWNGSTSTCVPTQVDFSLSAHYIDKTAIADGAIVPSLSVPIGSPADLSWTIDGNMKSCLTIPAGSGSDWNKLTNQTESLGKIASGTSGNDTVSLNTLGDHTFQIRCIDSNDEIQSRAIIINVTASACSTTHYKCSDGIIPDTGTNRHNYPSKVTWDCTVNGVTSNCTENKGPGWHEN